MAVVDNVRAAIAKARKVRPDSFVVELVEDTGPNVQLYTVRGPGREDLYDTVLVANDTLVLDRVEARALALAAWPYTLEKRSASVVQFARVMGLLEGRAANCAVVLESFDIASRSRWRDELFLPRETERGVEFWVSPGGDALLHLSHYQFAADGSLQIDHREIASGTARDAPVDPAG